MCRGGGFTVCFRGELSKRFFFFFFFFFLLKKAYHFEVCKYLLQSQLLESGLLSVLLSNSPHQETDHTPNHLASENQICLTAFHNHSSLRHTSFYKVDSEKHMVGDMQNTGILVKLDYIVPLMKKN